VPVCACHDEPEPVSINRSRSLNDIFTFILRQEDSAGALIIGAISTLFVVGMLDLAWSLFRLAQNRRHLQRAKSLFSSGRDPQDWPSLPDDLAEAGIHHRSAIFKRIFQMVEARRNHGSVDQQHLAEITQGRAGTEGSLARFLLGTLIVFGLVGTLWGLSLTILEVSPLIDETESFEGLQETLQNTLRGMETAFATTLAGLISSLALGFAYWIFQRTQIGFLISLEEFISSSVAPFFQQSDTTSLGNLHQVVREFSGTTRLLKQASEANVAILQEALQDLSVTSFQSRLEQQEAFGLQFRESAESLAESLSGVRENQVLIRTSVSSFEKMTATLLERSRVAEETQQSFLDKQFAQLEEAARTANQRMERGLQGQQELFETFREAVDVLNEKQGKALTKMTEGISESVETVARQQEAVTGYLQRLAGALDEWQAREEDLIGRIEGFIGKLASSNKDHQEELQALLNRQFQIFAAEDDKLRDMFAEGLEASRSGQAETRALLEGLHTMLAERADRDARRAEEHMRSRDAVADQLAAIAAQIERSNEKAERTQADLVSAMERLVAENELRTPIEHQSRVLADLGARMGDLADSIQNSQIGRSPIPENLVVSLDRLNENLGAMLEKDALESVLHDIHHTLEKSRFPFSHWGSRLKRLVQRGKPEEESTP